MQPVADFMEFLGGAVKKYLRETRDYSFEALKANLPCALASVGCLCTALALGQRKPRRKSKNSPPQKLLPHFFPNFLLSFSGFVAELKKTTKKSSQNRNGCISTNTEQKDKS
jgi:hypothetical protein